MSRKLTQEEVCRKVAARNVDIEILESYTDSKTPFLCRCKTCKHEWRVTLSNILHGRSCPKCAVRRNADRCRHTLEDLMVALKSCGACVEIVGDYVNSKTPTMFRCTRCGHEWLVRPDNLLSGYGCPECWKCRRIGINRKNNAVFVEQMTQKHPFISVESVYITAKDPINLRCMNCGFEWTNTPDKLINHGRGCPQCVSSYGEQAIVTYLSSRGISYTPWKKFDDLFGLGGGKLSYDFYLPDHNLLIEYQGEFHDESADQEFFHNDLDRQRAHDRLKREYAKSHQIQLLEIWYYDFKKINDILDAALAS